MLDCRPILTQRLAAVRERLDRACRNVGRSSDTVKILAVTKTVGPEVVAQALLVGLTSLGENRPQELWRKAPKAPEAEWHLIGHLQRNKIERTLPLVQLIHSLDSLRLLEALDAEAARTQRVVQVLLEVNVSGEASKQGFSPQELLDTTDALSRFSHISLCGLMTMAPYEEAPERTRPIFAGLRHLRDQWKPHLPSHHPMDQLSMGMSNDFDVAVEEGATLVRLGSILFEGLEDSQP